MSDRRTVKVFYSWQSEAFPKVCRNLIEECLKKAIKELNHEVSLSEPDREEQGEVRLGPIVMEKDTAGVPGSPDIVESIFRKISEADIFVGDLTVVRPGDHLARPASNANVLIETGYALRVLGRDRVILAFNTHFGVIPNDLPFNLRQTSICGYGADPESMDLPQSKKALTSMFKAKLRDIISVFKPAPPPLDAKTQALHAIQSGSRSRKKLVESYFTDILARAANFAIQGRQAPDAFLKSLDRALDTLHPVFEVIDTIAEQDDAESLNVCIKGFSHLLNVIWQNRTYDGTTDLPKLLGYIVYCYIAAAFIKEGNFATLAGFLEEQISVRLISGEPHTFNYGEFSRDISSLKELDGRGYYGPVGEVVQRLCKAKQLPLTAEAYVEADTLLWLRSELLKDASWFPRACQLLHSFPPELLLQARSKKVAARLAPLLGLETLEGSGARIQGAFADLYKQLGQSKGEAVGYYIYQNKPERFASV